jgi:hypothetical protein
MTHAERDDVDLGDGEDAGLSGLVVAAQPEDHCVVSE